MLLRFSGQFNIMFFKLARFLGEHCCCSGNVIRTSTPVAKLVDPADVLLNDINLADADSVATDSVFHTSTPVAKVNSELFIVFFFPMEL